MNPCFTESFELHSRFQIRESTQDKEAFYTSYITPLKKIIPSTFIIGIILLKKLNCWYLI